MVIDTDGSAFITKAEFDSLKNNFQAQIDTYNSSIDSKIDGAIAAYLAGIQLQTLDYQIEIDLLNDKIYCTQLLGGSWMTSKLTYKSRAQYRFLYSGGKSEGLLYGTGGRYAYDFYDNSGNWNWNTMAKLEWRSTTAPTNIYTVWPTYQTSITGMDGNTGTNSSCFSISSLSRNIYVEQDWEGNSNYYGFGLKTYISPGDGGWMYIPSDKIATRTVDNFESLIVKSNGFRSREWDVNNWMCNRNPDHFSHDGTGDKVINIPTDPVWYCPYA